MTTIYALLQAFPKFKYNELKQRGVETVKDLASLPLPLQWNPERGSALAYSRIREQARVQVESRESGVLKYELLPVEAGFGLTCLPAPSLGDVFLDLEGDPFVGEQGLEYFFGYQFLGDDGQPAYRGDWAFSRAQEKQTFEAFIDFVMARWKKFPDLHIYHYAPYEQVALKRLMGRYATREEELDRMLRAKLFVDLYGVVRHSLRAGVESYSIKQLEPLYDFERNIALADAKNALAALEANIELGDIPAITDEIQSVVSGYNQDDCRSAACLRDWLELLRAELIGGSTDVPRPVHNDDGAPDEKITDWLIKIGAIIEQLTVGVPADPEERDEEQQARWILANILDWHRREQKAVWWEYFRLADLAAEDLLEERVRLSGLAYDCETGGTARCPIHRYRFPLQETDLRGCEKDLRNLGRAKLGSVESISFEKRTVEIRKRQGCATLHPEAVFAHKVVDAQVMADSLVRIGEYVAANGMRGDGLYQAARDLLLKEPPRLGGRAIRHGGETTLEAATRLTAHLAGGILPIQGPPGPEKPSRAPE
jgi:hypothetical protein